MKFSDDEYVKHEDVNENDIKISWQHLNEHVIYFVTLKTNQEYALALVKIFSFSFPSASLVFPSSVSFISFLANFRSIIEITM